MKGSEQPTSEKKYKSPHRQFGQNDNCPKKIHKIYKTVEMYSTQKNELNNVGAHRREPRFGRKRNVLGARDLRMDIGAHPGSPTQPC